MQIKLNVKIVFILATFITACLAQKGGSYGKTLLNENRSPARQIQQQQVFQQAAVAPIVQQTFQQAPVQQYEDDQAAVAGPVRQRPGEAALSAPIPDSDDGSGEQHPAPEPYSFSYSVNDEQSGSEISREESQDASGNVIGFYHIRDAEGRMRRVDYTAGPEGFRAVIRSNEEGLANKDSADAKYEVDEVPADRQNAAALAAQSRAQAAGYGQQQAGPSAGLSGSLSGSSYADEAAAAPQPQSSYALAGNERQRLQPQTKGLPKAPSSFVSPVQQQRPVAPLIQQTFQPAPIVQQQQQPVQPTQSTSYFPSRPAAAVASTSTQEPQVFEQQHQQQQQQSEEDTAAIQPIINHRHSSSHSSSFPSRITPILRPVSRVQPQQFKLPPFFQREEYEDQQRLQSVKSKRWALPLNIFLPKEYRS
ncbi:hypothetical protein DERP_000118 [Dermatophagoides pteronyssinus]|uniref:Uncharacterized protein n=1 Tax=Dermatophagoides pteronyssinus TaxID=6956 RepID=A0ABQ8IZC5_DERPT|nr:hypothetical protein DERP_000118 [Dermatophagoides pteronyssinus]